MEDTRLPFIKKLLQEGKYKDDIKRELISQGFASDGYEVLYEKLIVELGIEEPKKPATRTFTPDITFNTKNDVHADYPRPKRHRMSPLPLVLFLVLVGAAFFFWQQSQTSDEATPLWGEGSFLEALFNGLSVGDKVLQSKVKTTAVSAGLFGNRMNSLDGVCRDITVVSPILCQGTHTSFTIFTKMSSGDYFCIDGSDFEGIIKQRPANAGSCL